MTKKKKAHQMMNKATDQASNALNGVDYQNSDSITAQFNASVDKASELASAKHSKKE